MVFGSIMANGIPLNSISLNGILNGISVNGLSTVYGSIVANGICLPFSDIPLNGLQEILWRTTNPSSCLAVLISVRILWSARRSVDENSPHQRAH